MANETIAARMSALASKVLEASQLKRRFRLLLTDCTEV